MSDDEVKKFTHTYMDMSRALSSWGYGSPVRNLHEFVRSLVKGQAPATFDHAFTVFDRGSLLRIAEATEATSKAVTCLAWEMRKFTKELRSMMKFWRELKDRYELDQDARESS